MPHLRRSRSLILRHLSLSLRKAGLEEETKRGKEKRLSLFSILVSHHPLLALRAHLQASALKSTLLARFFFLEKPADDSRSQAFFLSFFFFYRILRALERSERARTSGQYFPRGLIFFKCVLGDLWRANRGSVNRLVKKAAGSRN